MIDLNSSFDKPISNTKDVDSLTIKNQNLKKILYDLVDKKKEVKEFDRPLHIAVKNGQLDLSKELVMEGASIYSINGAGHTPLDETYDYNQPKIRTVFESFNQKIPDDVKSMHKIKFLSVFFATRGNVTWENQSVRMEDGISFRIVEKFLDYAKNYSPPDNYTQKEIDKMREIFKCFENSSKLLGNPNRTDIAFANILKSKVTILDSGSSAHATYGVFLNMTPSCPNKLLYAHINRGGGSQNHQSELGFDNRSDVSYILDISKLKNRELWSFVNDINSIGDMDYDGADKFVYSELAKKYGLERLLDSSLATYQKNQTVGNCPASSLKGTLKFLFHLEFGRERGYQLFYDMISKIKARAFLDTLVALENNQNKKTIGDLIKLYVPKIKSRAILKNDRVFFVELENQLKLLLKSNKNPKTTRILINILSKICK